MLLATLAYLLQDVLNRRLLFKTNLTAVAPKGKPSPIISSFLELGEENNRAAKFVAAQKVLLKRNPANIRKWITPGFILQTFILPLEARVYCSPIIA